MARIRRIPLALAVILVGALGVAGAAATAATHRGTLTKTEYTQLTQEQAALKKALHEKYGTWARVSAACQKAGNSTELLRRQRSSCIADVGFDQSLSNFYPDEQRCQALTTTGTTTGTTTTGTTTTGTTTTGTTTTGTTTTGTTTTPSEATVIQELACLNPAYQVVTRSARAMYAADAAFRHATIARRFTGRCLTALSGKQGLLADEKRFVSASARLAADVALLSRVQSGQAPTSDINRTQIKADATAYEKTILAVAAKTAGTVRKLSVCPHE
jgi:hypothetical protein